MSAASAGSQVHGEARALPKPRTPPDCPRADRRSQGCRKVGGRGFQVFVIISCVCVRRSTVLRSHTLRQQRSGAVNRGWAESFWTTSLASLATETASFELKSVIVIVAPKAGCCSVPGEGEHGAPYLAHGACAGWVLFPAAISEQLPPVAPRCLVTGHFNAVL